MQQFCMTKLTYTIWLGMQVEGSSISKLGHQGPPLGTLMTTLLVANGFILMMKAVELLLASQLQSNGQKRIWDQLMPIQCVTVEYVKDVWVVASGTE